MINNSINRFLGVVCYPLISIELVQEDLFEQFYRKTDKNEKIKVKGLIQKKVIAYLQKKYSLYSYDEINLYLDKFFFYPLNKWKSAYECYEGIWAKLAKSLISQRNGKLVFKYWENEDDKSFLGGFSGKNKLLIFHSLNRHMPIDILAITYLVDNGTTEREQLHNFYGNISVADSQLDLVLERGVAENHLHSGASRSFLSTWNSMMEPLTKAREGSFENLMWKDSLYFQEDELWFDVLAAAAIRIAIALMIKGKLKLPAEEKKLQELLGCFLKDKMVYGLYQRSENGDKNKKRKNIFAYFISVWEEMAWAYDLKNDKNISAIFETEDSLKTTEENIFLFETILYLKRQKESGEVKSRQTENIKILFIKYLRIKNTLFHLLVQQKTIKGLDYFQSQHYEHNSAAGKVYVKNFWQTAIREQFQNENLHKIEFRTSIPDKYSDFEMNIRSFLDNYLTILQEDYCIKDENGDYIPVRKFPHVGIVLHLLKRPDRTSPVKCYEDGKKDDGKIEFGVIKKQYLKQIDNLKHLRNENSEFSRYIVGLDAASLENSTPVWAFAEVYEKARDSSNEPLIMNNRMECCQSLGFTFHAGEDFRHMYSGIRRIDEAVTHLKFHAGDRIGHGIALGLDVQNWFLENPAVILPRIEALENFLWAYDLISSNILEFNSSSMAYIEKQIYNLSKDIYLSTEGLSSAVLVDAYLGMFKIGEDNLCRTANEKSFCEAVKREEPVVWNSEKLQLARNCKYYLERMNEPVHVEVNAQDLEIIGKLQKIVKEKISRQGIVIEINPSSNTAIADMDSLMENHIYGMNSFVYDASNIMVCINSDDPSVFNTNVSNELAYVYYGLLEKGAAKESAVAWIEKLRKNGMDSSFIKRKETDEQLLARLQKLLQTT